jgi:proline iminopeptidase
MKYHYSFPKIFLAIVFINSFIFSVTAQREKASDGIVTLTKELDTIVPYLPRLCDSLTTKSSHISIGDCKLFVETEGEGEPIILINGGPGGTHHYFHPWFSTLNDQATIIYYDQRGTGQSDFKPNEGYSFEQAVSDLEELRKKLGYKQWTLVGYSYGGGLAQFYAIKYPEYVKGLVVINALPMLPNVEFENAQNKYISEIERDRINEIISDYRNGKLPFKAVLLNLTRNGDWKRQHFYKPEDNELIRAALYEWVNDKNFNKTMNTSLNKYNFENAFDTCPIPTLVLEGGKDLTWGNAKHEIFRKNHPEEFFSLVSEFIKNGKKASSQDIHKWVRMLNQMDLMVESQ